LVLSRGSTSTLIIGWSSLFYIGGGAAAAAFSYTCYIRESILMVKKLDLQVLTDINVFSPLPLK
jgi:hypothetical protein